MLPISQVIVYSLKSTGPARCFELHLGPGRYPWRRRYAEAGVRHVGELLDQPVLGQAGVVVQDRLDRTDGRMHGESDLGVGQVRAQRAHDGDPFLDVVTLSATKSALV